MKLSITFHPDAEPAELRQAGSTSDGEALLEVLNFCGTSLDLLKVAAAVVMREYPDISAAQVFAAYRGRGAVVEERP